jgi:hypothetical protein
MLLDDFLPIYDVSDAVATVVNADRATTWAALMDVDLISVGRERPLVGVLSAVRALPDVLAHVLRGDGIPATPKTLRLREMPRLAGEQGEWILLGERPQEEIALGVVGKFWRPVIEMTRVTRDEFRDFAQPGFAKTIYSLSVQAIDEQHTQLVGSMRTATTDAAARQSFRRYWTFGVGSGAHVLVNAVLETVRDAVATKSRQREEVKA